MLDFLLDLLQNFRMASPILHYYQALAEAYRLRSELARLRFVAMKLQPDRAQYVAHPETYKAKIEEFPAKCDCYPLPPKIEIPEPLPPPSLPKMDIPEPPHYEAPR